MCLCIAKIKRFHRASSISWCDHRSGTVCPAPGAQHLTDSNVSPHKISRPWTVLFPFWIGVINNPVLRVKIIAPRRGNKFPLRNCGRSLSPAFSMCWTSPWQVRITFADQPDDRDPTRFQLPPPALIQSSAPVPKSSSACAYHEVRVPRLPACTCASNAIPSAVGRLVRISACVEPILFFASHRSG